VNVLRIQRKCICGQHLNNLAAITDRFTKTDQLQKFTLIHGLSVMKGSACPYIYTACTVLIPWSGRLNTTLKTLYIIILFSYSLAYTVLFFNLSDLILFILLILVTIIIFALFFKNPSLVQETSHSISLWKKNCYVYTSTSHWHARNNNCSEYFLSCHQAPGRPCSSSTMASSRIERSSPALVSKCGMLQYHIRKENV